MPSLECGVNNNVKISFKPVIKNCTFSTNLVVGHLWEMSIMPFVSSLLQVVSNRQLKLDS